MDKNMDKNLLNSIDESKNDGRKDQHIMSDQLDTSAERNCKQDTSASINSILSSLQTLVRQMHLIQNHMSDDIRRLGFVMQATQFYNPEKQETNEPEFGYQEVMRETIDQVAKVFQTEIKQLKDERKHELEAKAKAQANLPKCWRCNRIRHLRRDCRVYLSGIKPDKGNLAEQNRHSTSNQIENSGGRDPNGSHRKDIRGNPQRKKGQSKIRPKKQSTKILTKDQ